MRKNILLSLIILGILVTISLERPEIRTLEEGGEEEEEEEPQGPKKDPLLETGKCKDNGLVEIGQTVYLCMHLKGYNKRVMFKLEVDKYSVLGMLGGYELARRVKEETKYFTGKDKMEFVAQINNKFTKIPAVK